MMETYFIVIISVCVLCLFADQIDYVENPEVNDNLVDHTTSTRYLYFAAACILILVSGLRYMVGTDYWNYYYGYARHIERLPESIWSFQDPGYGIIALFSSWFWNDGASAIFLSALLTVGLTLIVIYRHTDRLLMATFLYITLGCWHSSFNGVKQYLAAAILFCGIDALRREEYLKWLAFVLVAALFHRSAIVMAVLCLLVYRKIGYKNLVITLLITVIAAFSYDRIVDIANIIMDKDYNPAGEYVSQAVNRLRVATAIIPAVVFFAAYKDKKDITRTEIFYVNICLIHAGICVFTMNSALLYRIGIYTTPFLILAITELSKRLSDKLGKVITIGMLGMYFTTWWYEISIRPSLVPFRFIWER